jgi:GT2 family glycosyltransferase
MRQTTRQPYGGSTAPFVSVVVPVYNGGAQLRACVAALEVQTYPRDRYEVIVVDNGSTDGCTSAVGEFSCARLEQEPVPSSYAARNRGIAVARGEVIAFTDADCVPAPDWLEQGVAHLGRIENCGLLGGRVELFYGVPARPTALEQYERLFDFDQERLIAAGRFAMTANAFTYRSVVERVGPFDARMKSVGDRDLGNRIAAAGYAQAFAPGAIVKHAPRGSFAALVAKRRRVAGGHHDLAQKTPHPRGRFLAALGQQLAVKPLRGVSRLWSAGPEMSLTMKLRVLGLLLVLCYAEALERVRLAAGGESRRG